MNRLLRWLILADCVFCLSYAASVRAQGVTDCPEATISLVPIAKPYGSIWLKKNDGRVVQVTDDQLNEKDQRLLSNAAKGRIAEEAAKTAAGSSVQIVSLAVTKGHTPFDPSKAYDPLDGETMKLELLASCPGKHIIAFNESASELTQLSDDRGTNLLTDELGRNRASFFSFIKVYHGGDQAMITLNSPRKPVAEARTLQLKGNMVFQSAVGEQTVEPKNLDIKKGDSFRLGKIKVKISDKGSGSNFAGAMFGQIFNTQEEKTAMTIHLLFQSPIDPIKKIQFFDADGKLIKHREGGTSSSFNNDERKYDIEYGLMKKVDTLAIKITYYDKVEQISVPLSIETGLGL